MDARAMQVTATAATASGSGKNQLQLPVIQANSNPVSRPTACIFDIPNGIAPEP